MDTIMDYFNQFMTALRNCQVPEQIQGVDYVGLFSNPWFLVPFGIIIALMIWRKAWKYMILLAIAIGIWVFTGTEFAKTMTVNGEIQLSKVIPTLLGGGAILAFVVYLFFGRPE